MTKKPSKNKDLRPESAGGRDSTPHPPVGGALPHLDSGGVGGDQPQQIPGPPPESTENPQKSGSPLEDPPPIHVLATFYNQSDLLAGMRRAASWIILSEEAAHRALLPALTHVTKHEIGPVSDVALAPTQPPGHRVPGVRRLDELTLPEALNVIRALADEREQILSGVSHPGPGNLP